MNSPHDHARQLLLRGTPHPASADADQFHRLVPFASLLRYEDAAGDAPPASSMAG